MRIFIGDGPAQHFETGESSGGDNGCSGCASDARGQSTSHLRTGKILFLQGLLVDSKGMVAYVPLTSLRKKRF